jgi:peptidoglycan/xylan/chitin deacetylase (PgdA/CDA1 family)
VAAVAAAWITYLFNLPYFLGALNAREVLNGNHRDSRPRVALLHSRHTEAQFIRVGGDYARVLRIWKELLAEQQITYAVINDSDVERAAGLAGYDVVILPAAVALTERALGHLKRFVREGNGVVADWATGTRDADGQWRGWQFLSEVAGIEILEMVPRNSDQSLLTVLRGESPLVRGLPGGYRLKTFSYNEIVLARSADPDAYWSYERTPLVRPPNPAPLASIARWMYGQGRTVWFGFSVDAIRNSPEDRQVLGQIITNAITWVARRPMALLVPWPRGAPVAAVFALDAEEGFPNTLRAAELFRRQGVQGTFFMLSDVAEHHPQVVELAKAAGEIAVHGDSHVPFAGQPAEVQYRRLAKAKASLAELSRGPILSFHPPYEAYDESTLVAAARTELQILFVRLSDRSSPKIASVGNPPRPLLMLPSIYVDDYWAFQGLGLTPAQALEEFKRDLDQAALDTGLYVFSFHTTPPWGLAEADRLSHLEELIQYAKGKGVWIARLDAVADWWLARGQVGVTLRRASETRTILSVTNKGSKAIPDQRLDFFPPRLLSSLRPAAEKVKRFSFGLPGAGSSVDVAGAPPGEEGFVQKRDRVRLALFNLRPGETRTLVFDH